MLEMIELQSFPPYSAIEKWHSQETKIVTLRKTSATNYFLCNGRDFIAVQIVARALSSSVLHILHCNLQTWDALFKS